MKSFRPKMVEGLEEQKHLDKPSVTEYMATLRQLITFTPDTPIITALDSLIENRITGAPVLNDKHEVVGMIDDKDCLKILVGSGYYDFPIGKETVADYMSDVMKTISDDHDIFMAANIFLTSPFKRLIIVDKHKKLIGQISRRDILTAIKDLKLTTW